MALLPSGKMLHVDEKVVVSVPLVYGDEYYLACGFGEKGGGVRCGYGAFRPARIYVWHLCTGRIERDRSLSGNEVQGR